MYGTLSAYLSMLLINKASIVPKMTMLFIGFLQSAMSMYNFADGLVGATTEVLTDMAIEGSKNVATSTALVLLSSAQLLSSMAGRATNIVGEGILRAGDLFEIPSFSQIPSISKNVLPVVIATVTITKDTVTGLYTVASFKNAVIATIVLSRTENRLFGTDIIRNTVQDAAIEGWNEFIDISGARRVPEKIEDLRKNVNSRLEDLTKNVGDRTSETVENIRNQMNNMSTTTKGFGAAGLIVLAGVVLIAADS